MKENHFFKFNPCLFVFISALICVFLPFIVQATEIEFNIDPSYDYNNRSKVSAFLHQLGNNAYFYVENDYYQNLDVEQRKNFTETVRNLSQEFDGLIYPKLTEQFGSEWKPGIDKDDKITVLLTRIKNDSAGYFNEADEHLKIEAPTSNQKEMLYLNVKYIASPLAKSYLAHELLHLITFNQKNKNYNVTEEIWLNEGRAEIAPTFLGYDQNYDGSNLQKRVRTFAQKPNDPLTEWQNASFDYAEINLFFQYFLDHYGINVLADSLKSNKTGIASLNEALKKNGYNEDFGQIFTNWQIALYVNDCSFGPKYCYLNPNLKNLKVASQLNYLPLTGESTLTAVNYSKNWMPNWIKFIGGKGTLKFDFIGDSKVIFKIPYFIEDSAGKYSLKFLDLNASQHGVIYLSDFGSKYNSLTILPSIQSKLSNFETIEPYYQFILTASISSQNLSQDSDEEVKKLLSQISILQQEIARLQIQIAQILAQQGNPGSNLSCSKINNNLYYGMRNNSEVRCLQEFLKKQGTVIYPEGLITGNFLSLTKAAVIRFQEKYAAEILAPLSLKQGTGFVGTATRAKINQLLTP